VPSVHEQCLAATAVKIRSLTLPGLEPERVYEQLVRFDTNVVYPCVLVSSDQLREKVEWFSNVHLRIHYPVGVYVLHRGDVADASMKGPYLGWRDLILARLHAWKPEVAGVLRARVEVPEKVVEPRGPNWLRVAGGLVVWCEIVQDRGE
jgi:hypothetical protein